MSNEYTWYIIAINGFNSDHIKRISTLLSLQYSPQQIFCPLISISKYNKKRQVFKSVTFPVLLNYIFIRSDIDIYKLDKYIKRHITNDFEFLKVGDTLSKVSNNEIEELKKQLENIVSLNYDFKLRDKVKILTGPFENFIAQISKIDNHNKEVTLRVKVFNKITILKMPFNSIEKL